MLNLCRDEIKDIVIKAKEEISTINSDRAYLKKAIELAVNNLETLPDMLENTDFNIIFMGKPGCGKTSTIANLAQMLSDDLFNVHIKPITKIKSSLLPVGSGGTTMAENIVIVQTVDEESKIQLECYTSEEMRNTIESYVEKQYMIAMGNYLKAYIDTDIEETKNVNMEYPSMPREVERYIENMCKKGIDSAYQLKDEYLFNYCTPEMWINKKGKKETPELNKIVRRILDEKNKREKIYSKNDIIDQVVEELVDFIIDRLIMLKDEFKNNPKQVKYEISFEKDTSIKKNIQRNMMNLNSGGFVGIPIIRNIKIIINKNDLDMQLHNNKYKINCIVDTRGYRYSEEGKKKKSDGVREDYKQYLSDKRCKNICIFMEKYMDSSGAIPILEEIIKYNVLPSYHNGLNAIVINWQAGEIRDNADNVDGYNDDYDDYDDYDIELDEGIESEDELAQERVFQLKSHIDALSTVKSKNLNFNSDNIFMYNPLSGYSIEKNDLKGEIVRAYDAKLARERRNVLLTNIFDMVEREHQRIEKKIVESYEMIKRFLEFGEISINEIQDQILNELYLEAKRVITQVANYCIQNGFFDIYYDKIENSFHSRAYKPLAMHKGEYKGQVEVSVYKIANEMFEFYTRHIIEFKRKIDIKYNQIKDKCRGADDLDSLFSPIDDIMEDLHNSLDQYAEDLSINFENVIKDREYFSNISSVWKKAQERANMGGRGVNNDIREILLNCISEVVNVSLYGTFKERCEEIQSNMERILTKLVDCSFGYYN